MIECSRLAAGKMGGIVLQGDRIGESLCWK